MNQTLGIQYWQRSFGVFFDDREIVWRVVLQRLRGRRFQRFLDIGAGDGYVTERLARYANETVAIEPVEERVNAISERHIPNLTIFSSKAELFPLSAARFDLVLLSHSVYYIKGWSTLLHNLRRALSENGALIMITQTGSGSFHTALNIVRKTVFPERRCVSYPYLSLLAPDNPPPPVEPFYFTIETVFDSVQTACEYVENLFRVSRALIHAGSGEALKRYLEAKMTDAGVVLTDVQFGAEWKYPEIPEFAKEAPAIAE